jgi:hypothetical protein
MYEYHAIIPEEMTTCIGRTYREITEKGGKPYYWVGISIKDWRPTEEGQNIL